MKDYSKLQNGSDIRGVSIEGIPGQDPNLTSGVASDIARGFLVWLCRKTKKAPEELTLAVGRDPRITGEMLFDGLMEGFGPYGVRVLDCGLASTPAMFMATVFSDFSCDGTIMITASHLPYNRNGFKFFTRGGGLNKEDIKAILAFAQDPETAKAIPVASAPRPAEAADIITPYSAYLRELILRGADLSAAVAGLYPCGEGAGYAGGISSAAVDGMRCAEAVLRFVSQK